MEEVDMSCLWKHFQDKMLHQNTIAKRHFFGFQIKDFIIQDIFYKIQN